MLPGSGKEQSLSLFAAVKLQEPKNTRLALTGTIPLLPSSNPSSASFVPISRDRFDRFLDLFFRDTLWYRG